MNGEDSGPPFSKEEWDALRPNLQKLYPNRALRDGDAGKSKAACGIHIDLVVDGAAGQDSHASPLVPAVCSNFPTRPASPSLSGIVDSPEHPSRDPEVSGPVPKKRTTMRKVSPSTRISGASKQSATGLFRELVFDLGKAVGDDKLDQFISSPSGLSTAIKTPVSTARKSQRPRDNGESIVMHVERRAVEKDLSPAGTPSIIFPQTPCVV